MPEDDRRMDWALWRYGVLGPLVSTLLEHGDRAAFFREAANRRHVDPDGNLVQLSARTVESWYYEWKNNGLAGLKRDQRSDRGDSGISKHLQDRLVALKLERPRRSIRRLIRMLERAGEARNGELTRSSVQRLLKIHGISGRLAGSEPTERRSFLHQAPGDLWMGDVLHGPRVIAGGRLRKSYVIAFIDSATRFVVAAEVRLSETAADHEYALKQGILKYGLPRKLYLDNGAAQRSRSLRQILAELSVELLHTEAYDPEAKGSIERWNRTWREEVQDELPDDPLPLEELQSRTWAWLSVEYNARVHHTTGDTPRDHWLRDSSSRRSVARTVDLDEVFLHREKRVVRRDATVRFRGDLLEVRSSLIGKKVELRFDAFGDDQLPQVFVDDKFFCDTVLQDLIKNSTRRRHRPKGTRSQVEKTGLDPLKQMQDEQIGNIAPLSPPTAPDPKEDPDV